ncbi:hypothetical protein X943_000960 [Babesia divergens]|uniref:50S ribosomal protein L35 n=1 Tax=Babesia divergens TaxID=32595 RepID=A0AAD9GE92_BABDI|nr:hypothetical protein X943_000960 [Babesia divergens]
MRLLHRKLWNICSNRVLSAVQFPSLYQRPSVGVCNLSIALCRWNAVGIVPGAFSRQSLRAYNPARHIDWVGIKRRWRSKQLFMKKRKLKNHPRVALRFRLTRFGWERLQQGRRGRKLHLSAQKRRNKRRIRFVSRHDLVKLTRQMPGHRLRIRDPPINTNPNIQRLRSTINNYFA